MNCCSLWKTNKKAFPQPTDSITHHSNPLILINIFFNIWKGWVSPFLPLFHSLLNPRAGVWVFIFLLQLLYLKSLVPFDCHIQWPAPMHALWAPTAPLPFTPPTQTSIMRWSWVLPSLSDYFPHPPSPLAAFYRPHSQMISLLLSPFLRLRM